MRDPVDIDFDKTRYIEGSNMETLLSDLKEQFLEDEAHIADVVLDGSFLDQEAFWLTMRAMVIANMRQDFDSVRVHGRDIATAIEAALEEKAEYMANK